MDKQKRLGAGKYSQEWNWNGELGMNAAHSSASLTTEIIVGDYRNIKIGHNVKTMALLWINVRSLSLCFKK